MKKVLMAVSVFLSALIFAQILFAQTDTPEKFKPLVRKWEWNENINFPVKFEIFSVDNDGNVIVKYINRSYEVPTNGTASIDGAGKLHLILKSRGKMATVIWELEYSPKWKGMLFGTAKSSAFSEPSEVKVYPAD